MEADRLFGSLARFAHVVSAVSGGPDSLALLHLIAEWRARRPSSLPAPYLTVVTIDHRLRPESRSEAEFVEAQCQVLDLNHVILDWTGAKPASGLPNAARDARYRLLEAYAAGLAGNGARAIVTAHHEDDQAETFVMRLARGSGVDGLSSMAAERLVSASPAIVLARPLLSISKCRLLASIEARGLTACHDPTNEDPMYERVRMRRALPQLASAGISAKSLALAARRIGAAREALDWAANAYEASLDLQLHNEIFASFDRNAFAAGPRFLRQRILSRLIDRFGGASPTPTLSEIETMCDRLETQPFAKSTLGGAIVISNKQTIRVWRESGRVNAADVVLHPGEALIWDERFWVSRGAAATSPVTVRPLGPHGFATMVGALLADNRPPAKAAHALPAFWSGARLLAVPLLAPFATPLAQAALTAGDLGMRAVASDAGI